MVIGKGNGNSLQCSCLENPSDRGAWRADVYGAAQSQTRLKWLSSSSIMVNSKVAEEWNSEWGRFLKSDLAHGWNPHGTERSNIPLRKKLSVKTWDFCPILWVKPVPKVRVMFLSCNPFPLFFVASWSLLKQIF